MATDDGWMDGTSEDYEIYINFVTGTTNPFD